MGLPALQVQVLRQQHQTLEQSTHLLLLPLLQLQNLVLAVLLKRLLLDRSKAETQHLLLQFCRQPLDHCCLPLDLSKKGRLWA